jgi:hypothetical protein
VRVPHADRDCGDEPQSCGLQVGCTMYFVFLSVYGCIYIYICYNVCMCISVCNLHRCVCAYIFVSIYMCIDVRVCVFMGVFMSAFMNPFMRVNLCHGMCDVCVCICDGCMDTAGPVFRLHAPSSLVTSRTTTPAHGTGATCVRAAR